MCTPEKITVARAAKLMGKTPLFVRECMRRGTLPIGTAEKLPGSSQWTFSISPAALADYLGCSVSDLYDSPPEGERPDIGFTEEQITFLCSAFERLLRTGGQALCERENASI